jgi:hypothetical protein
VTISQTIEVVLSALSLSACKLLFRILFTMAAGVAVNIVSEYTLDDRRSIPGRGKGFFV